MIWTSNETGEEFTTETVDLHNGRFYCVLLENSRIDATADTAEEATRLVLYQVEQRANPAGAQNAFERALKKVLSVHAGLFRRLAEHDARRK